MCSFLLTFVNELLMLIYQVYCYYLFVMSLN